MVVSALLIASALARAGRSALWPSVALAAPICIGAVGAWRVGGISSAVTVLISASVFAMLFCNGACILSSTHQDNDPPPAGATASLIFPLGVVLLLSGFAVRFTAAGLVGLGILGVLALDVTRTEQAISRPDAAAVKGRSRPLLSSIVALALAALLSFSMISVLKIAKDVAPLIRTDAFLVALLCPAIALPLLVKSMRASVASNLASATSLNASVACLLLTIALPAFVVADYAIRSVHGDVAGLTGLPPISWRLDSPLLIMSGFAMLGMRVGLLRPDRWVAVLLLLIYVSYILSGTLLRFG